MALENSHRESLHLSSAELGLDRCIHCSCFPNGLNIEDIPQGSFRTGTRPSDLINMGPLQKRVVSLRQLFDKRLCASKPCCFPNMLVVSGAGRVAQGDVVADLLWEAGQCQAYW